MATLYYYSEQNKINQLDFYALLEVSLEELDSPSDKRHFETLIYTKEYILVAQKDDVTIKMYQKMPASSYFNKEEGTFYVGGRFYFEENNRQQFKAFFGNEETFTFHISNKKSYRPLTYLNINYQRHVLARIQYGRIRELQQKRQT